MIQVVIPVYNCQQYLEQAVQSVLCQPYQEVEILLVDDGSTDNSPALCDAFARDYQNVYTIHQANRGLPTARNVGIEYFLEKGGKGYIAFLDSDDAWMPNSVDQKTASELSQGYSIVGFQSCTCNQFLTARSEPIQRKPGIFSGGSKGIQLGSNQHFASMFYSKELLQTYRLRFPDVKFCEDKMFRFRAVYLADSILLINRILYLYRHNPGSLVHTRPFGIAYYPTIIDAYLMLDSEMLQWKNENRGELTLGRNSALYYTMEMQIEHFRNGGTAKQFVAFLRENPHYQEMFINAGRLKDFEFLLKPTLKFICFNRLYGSIWRMARRVSYLPGIRNLLNKRRFKIKL